jgi:hypothetical protein
MREGAMKDERRVGRMSSSASPSATTLRGRSLLFARTAWVLVAVLALGIFIASIPSYVSNVLNPGQAGWMRAVEAPAGVVSAVDILGVVASISAVLLCLTLATVLFLRKSEDWMIMLVSSYLLVYGIVLCGPLQGAEDFYPGWPSLAEFVVQPLLFTMPTVTLFVLFPDGRFVPRWTRWLLVLSIPVAVAIFYVPYFYSAALLGVIVAGAMYSQIHRYRYVSTPPQRQQTKWVVFGVLLWVLLMGILFVPYSIELNLPAGSPLPWWTLVGGIGWWLTLTILPLSLSIAVLRYRLYEIDLIINRTLVYGSLTAMLALVYFGGVATTQAIFRTITGHEEQPQLAIVVSTLLIAALFNPLRRRIQSFIDRRFYRSKYDARKTLEAFSVKLRNETDLEALNNDLVGVVRETMQPEHVSLWLRPQNSGGRVGR